ncbi:DUF6446 family protein [Ruegeria sp. HKCCA5426]|uniref:DUF6446 family protein n=1 Tax=Ruegeria sp. HKCCA5426 TaxID=2682985 RepID=UPI0014898B10|nr:DUF6446 family protein [Ruegeria sp. HKCCA5426]
MTGKLLAILLLVSAGIAGAAMYYLQVYGFYYSVEPGSDQDVVLLSADGETSIPLEHTAFQAIDADSSPIRYRACFETEENASTLSAFLPAESPEPLTAPSWFECYDAVAIADALKSGQARAFVGVKNIHYGVDRIVAITEDGNGFVWHALNNCGEKAYDGTVVGEECPPRPES